MTDGYSLADYGSMIEPGPRRDAYVRALRERITPSSVVLDVGTGFGFFAVLAAKLGAAEVIGVDLAEVVHLGNKLAEDNGVADRVRFVQGNVEELRLSRPADLIISDLHGVLPFYTGHFGAVAAARRLLAPGGTLLPRRDLLFVAPIDDEKACTRWRVPWDQPVEGVSLAALRSFVVNEWRGARLKPEALLGPAAPWVSIDFATVDPAARVQGTVTLEIARPGTLRAVGVWFDLEVAPGIVISNAPGAPPLVYSQALFPLERPALVQPGDRVVVELAATPAGDDWDFAWHVRVTAAGTELPLIDERHHSMLARPLPALVKGIGRAPTSEPP